MRQKKQPKKLSSKDYEQLGKAIVTVYEAGFSDRKKFYTFTFIRGVLMGFGSVVGATIVVALLIWILSLFSSVPLIDNVRDTIKTEQR